MRKYNISFLIAALVLLLLLRFHSSKQKRLEDLRSRFFRCMLDIGLADVLFELLSTLLLLLQDGELGEVTRLTLTVFYLLQVFFPFALIYYIELIRKEAGKEIRRDVCLWMIVPVVMGVLVLMNYWSGLLFDFDQYGLYEDGPGYFLMYYYGFAYMLAALVISLVYYREIGKRNAVIIWEFLAVAVISMLIQAVSRTCLLTGFGIALGLMLFHLNLNNPDTYTDNLTGVFDKQYLRRWLDEKFHEGKPIHVLAVNAMNLVQINKVFGNHAGDEILVQIANELEKIDGAWVFRLSGRKFLLAMQTLSDYEQCRERLRKLFAEPFEVGGDKIRFPVVLCGVIGCEALQDEDTLLAYLDYMAGLMGSREDMVLIQSDRKLMEGFRYEQEVERFLNEAIEKDLFEVEYQPVYSLKRGGYVTLEALSRLHHPSLGYVPPDVFITLAEKNGQISQIGTLQFRRVCRYVKEHPQLMEKLLNIKFNLSPMELLKYGYGRTLLDIIEEYGLPCSFFQFEITETVATEYGENLYQAVEEFLRAGMTLCLDDFGSGYANISTVLKLPFSTIKIDRSLLRGVSGEEKIASFYAGLVHVLQSMGYHVVAEGAETEKEVELLRSWGVDLIQGYYFSKPLREEDVLKELG